MGQLSSNYADLLPEIPRYCCLVEIFIFSFIIFIEIRLKFKIACRRIVVKSFLSREVPFLKTQQNGVINDYVEHTTTLPTS